MKRDEERALDLANDELHLLHHMMEDKKFEYKGHVFKPVGNILGGFVVRSHHLDYRDVIKEDGYTYEDFYKIARKHHASVDVYEVDGKLYMPTSAGFVAVYNKPKIKTINQYERWYQ